MQKEYLITNSIGAYSSSTPELGNTRKYHGLLVAANLDLSRVNVVNRINEVVMIGNDEYALSTNIYKNNVLHPDSRKSLKNFEMQEYPIWSYEISGVKIKKEQVLNLDKNKVTLRYWFNNETGQELKLILTPLIANREIDSLSQETDLTQINLNDADKKLRVDLSKYRCLVINKHNFEFQKNDDTYFDFFYPIESERGYSALENLKSFGQFSAKIPLGEHDLLISFEYLENKNLLQFNEIGNDFDEYNSYQENLRRYFYEVNPIAESEFTNSLIKQADQFLINSLENVAILAGYHWFGEWGRDTFMCFKGLFLLTGKFEQAKMCLLKWNKYFKDGLLPNILFNENYDSLDCVLWFAVATWEYYQATNDWKTVKKILPNLERTLTSFQEGEHGFYINTDGFLVDEHENKALTWMDAIVEGKPVIDRSGMAVEIQSLWYNFLRILQTLKEKEKDTTHLTFIKSTAASLEKNFVKKYWNKSTSCLYDSIKGDKKDAAIRPNQIFVLYLPFKLLKSTQAKQILHIIQEKLLTPVGLKTLNKEAEKYHGKYSGDQATRDQAYHQGTVWMFLLGMYLVAFLETNNFSLTAKSYVNNKLDLLKKSIEEMGIDYLPEIFSADSLEAKGCISQAWSVAFIMEAVLALSTGKK